MGWRSEKALHDGGAVSWLVLDDETYEPHPEVLDYATTMRASSRAPNTLRAYMPRLAAFLNWCETEGVSWKTVNLLELARYKHHLGLTPSANGRVPEPATVGAHLTAVSEFLRYCAMAGHVEQRVGEQLVERKWVGGGRARGENRQFTRVRTNVLRVDTVEKPPRTIQPEVLDDLIRAASTDRDRLALRVMFDAGLRASELLGLRLEDMHLLPDSRTLGCSHPGPHIHVTPRPGANGPRVKSGRARVVPVTAAMVTAYRDYRYERAERCRNDSSAFVLVSYRGSAEGRPMTYSNLAKIVERLGHQVGVDLTPHMLRHTAATAWVEAGTAPDVVQELLGHALASSTAIYIHPSTKRMRAAVEAVHSRRAEAGS